MKLADIVGRSCSKCNMGDNGSVDSDNVDWNSEDELEIENFCGSPDLRNPDAGVNRQAKMDEDSGDCANIDWDTEDELEIQNFTPAPVSNISNPNGCAAIASGEMGFQRGIVEKAIEENGPENEDSIMETLLAYSASLALEDSPSDYDEFLDDLSDADSGSDFGEDLPYEDRMLLSLEKMGYSWEEASLAMKRCGPDASMDELADFIYASRIAKEADLFYQNAENEQKPKRIYLDSQMRKRIRPEGYTRRSLAGDEEQVRLPNPMIGFGVPALPYSSSVRDIPAGAVGPPYFYYENVALAPKGVWDTMKRFLYDIDPEFVDSKYFCAASRKRGYIHNLPISKRFPILPLAPRTIHEAFPSMRKWWPDWDTRKHFNCLRTSVSSAKVPEKVQKILEKLDGEPPLHVQKHVFNEVRKWNLVWVGRNKVATLEPDEVEKLLGLPNNHTRGGGISRTDRYKSLGNSFQIDTVAYHLSVLKGLFPRGINVLSLFSGIGGAEVALHRIGIPLKNVVSVEISEVNRNIIRSWWEQTDQKGNLIEYADVQNLTAQRLEQLISALGGFDLVIGGSPCNNITGSNRYSRTGLEGKDSVLFFHYFRILDLVKNITGNM